MAFPVLHLLLSIVFIFPLGTFSQRNGDISVGAFITAAEDSVPWLSPSRDFAFGFQKLQNQRDLFLLAIWFDKIPDKTICWYVRNSNPVLRGSTVQLTASSGLIVRDPVSQILWSAPGVADEVAYGFLNDTGNLVLLRSDSTRLWESFRNLADTILPTQTIEMGEMLISRKSEANFSQGRFYARMFDGNFVFNTRSVMSNSDFDDEYYNSETLGSGQRVDFNERASLFVGRVNQTAAVLSPVSIPSASSNYYRVTLNFDGVLTQYYHPTNFEGNPGWAVVDSWPANICSSVDGVKGSGACGYNSVCNIENKRPSCQCPRGFSLADPNDPFGDCLPMFLSSCVEGEQGLDENAFDLIEISDADWPYNDYQQIMPSTEQECKTSCMSDCFCGVAIYRSNSCWKKRLPLSNGKIDNRLNVKAFFKFRKADIPLIDPNVHTTNGSKKNDNTLITIGSVLLGSSVFLNILLVTAACLVFVLIYKRKIPVFYSFDDSTGSNLRCFTYKELEHATAGFQEELGRGAFGTVYKGELRNASKSPIAVKKLHTMARDSEKEFRAEVNAIGHTHHKNLVRLIGFCVEGPQRLLVYEFMSNGTLSAFLFHGEKPSWSQRIEIALGVARGLSYLHDECSSHIIHCDIKPQNILLDEYYTARISDFGVAKLLRLDQSHTTTNIRGTKGYVAPEWFTNNQITMKVDVYSFGVLLLEIVTCRRCLEHLDMGKGGMPVLTDWVLECFEEGRLDELVGDDSEALKDKETVERFVKVGIWCIQEDSFLRPTMRKVSQMLEGVVEVEEPSFSSL